MKLLAASDTLDQASPRDHTAFWRVGRHEGLECLTATFRTHVFPLHSHETYVIGTVLEGVNVFNIGGRRTQAGPGQMCFINPGEVHDTELCGAGFHYRMIYPSVALLRQMMARDGVRASGTPRFTSAVVEDAEAAAAFRRAHQALEHPDTALAADEALVKLFFTLMQRHGDQQGPGEVRGGARLRGEPAGVARAQAFLVAHLDESVSLEQVAAAAALSPHYLIRAFSRATGFTPYQWLANRRVQLACSLLRAGQPVTTVAAQCGFFDQSHFSRMFKSRLGVTPGRFRQAQAVA
jgi:AraC-like DNA-binding protein/quercetin dioxygenase-like cupin family protein